MAANRMGTPPANTKDFNDYVADAAGVAVTTPSFLAYEKPVTSGTLEKLIGFVVPVAGSIELSWTSYKDLGGGANYMRIYINGVDYTGNITNNLTSTEIDHALTVPNLDAGDEVAMWAYRIGTTNPCWVKAFKANVADTGGRQAMIQTLGGLTL